MNYPDRFDFTVDPKNDKSRSIPIFFMESAEAFGALHAQGNLGIFGPKGSGKTTLLEITAQRAELLKEEGDQVLVINMSDVLATGHQMPPRLAQRQDEFLGIDTGILRPYEAEAAENVEKHRAFRKITTYVTAKALALNGNQAPKVDSDSAPEMTSEDRAAEKLMYNDVLLAIDNFNGYLFIANAHHLTEDTSHSKMNEYRETVAEALLERLQLRGVHTAISHHAELDQYGQVDQSKLTYRAKQMLKAFKKNSIRTHDGSFSNPNDAQVILEEVMPSNVAQENIANLHSLGHLSMQEVMYVYHKYREAKEMRTAEILGADISVLDADVSSDK
jgi:hypothetical protein